MKILVTGATGNVGQSVVSHLLKDKVRVKAATTQPERRQNLNSELLEWIYFDFSDAQTFDLALNDVDAVFFMRPPHMGNAKAFIPFIDAMKKHKVKLVAFLSLMGIENNPFPPHYRIENDLRTSGLSTCMIRPGFFMQNLSGVHAEEVRESNCLFIPAGKSACSFVDAEDVGIAIAEVLKNYKLHLNTTYTITGSESLNYSEVATILSISLNRKIDYNSPNPIQYLNHMIRHRHFSLTYALVTLGLYVMTQLGNAKAVSNDYYNITGRHPRTLKQFIEENISAFQMKSEEVNQ